MQETRLQKDTFYYDREEALFNPNCLIYHLLQDIKRRCNCSREDQVDLSDVNGSVRGLVDNLKLNASDFLKAREKFILVRVEKIEGCERPIYTPLLKDEEFITDNYLDSLSRIPTGSLEGPGRTSKRQGTKSKMSKTQVSFSSSPNGGSSNAKNNSKQRRISQYRRS